MANLSMFREFKDVLARFKVKRKTTNNNLPAMIILERKETGENYHAAVGTPEDIITLFEWGISHFVDDDEELFEKCLEAIKMKHKVTKHLNINNIRKSDDEEE